MAAQDLDEGRGGELATLVGIRDLRHAVARDRFLQRLDRGIGR
jgi:hypothetical protein